MTTQQELNLQLSGCDLRMAVHVCKRLQSHNTERTVDIVCPLKVIDSLTAFLKAYKSLANQSWDYMEYLLATT